jgi:hypothetical protein
LSAQGDCLEHSSFLIGNQFLQNLVQAQQSVICNAKTPPLGSIQVLAKLVPTLKFHFSSVHSPVKDALALFSSVNLFQEKIFPPLSAIFLFVRTLAATIEMQ